MRCILAGSVGLALSLGALRGYAQETQRHSPAVTLGPPKVALGAPRAIPAPASQVQQTALSWSLPSRVVRAQSDDKAPMPLGQAQPGGTTPLPPPTPLGTAQPAPGMPLVSGPFLTNPELGGPVVSGPVTSDPVWPGVPVTSPCPPCDAGFAPLPGGVFVPDAHPAGYLIYGSAEYLLWWTRNAQLPPLLITGMPLTNFIIGNPVPVFGNNSITGQERSGGRFTLGWWFTRCQNWGLEGSYFFLGTRSSSVTFANPGTGVLARPFQTPTGMPDFEIIAFPGLSAGNFMATTSNELWGADINLRKNLWLGCRWRVDGLLGFRYLQFDEDVRITESFTGLPGGQFAGVHGMIHDNFEVNNNFYGGQFGLNSELRRGRWSLNLLTKVALGGTHQTVEIGGNQMIAATGPNAIPGTYPGLLAQPTNIGRRGRDVFAVVPEVGVNIGWQATHHLKLFVGYNFLYWSNVLRAGDQIDTVVDVVPSRLNGNPVPPLIQPVGATRPTVLFKDTDFWAQGINFGLQVTW